MSGFENWPAPILRRWLLSAAAGPVIFLIGLAGRIALHDPTLLTLSTLLAVWSFDVFCCFKRFVMGTMKRWRACVSPSGEHPWEDTSVFG